MFINVMLCWHSREHQIFSVLETSWIAAKINFAALHDVSNTNILCSLVANMMLATRLHKMFDKSEKRLDTIRYLSYFRSVVTSFTTILWYGRLSLWVFRLSFCYKTTLKPENVILIRVLGIYLFVWSCTSNSVIYSKLTKENVAHTVDVCNCI